VLSFIVLWDLLRANSRSSNALFGSLYTVPRVVLLTVEIVCLLLLFLCKSEIARGLGAISCIGGDIGSGAGSLS